ncbi:CHASE4 domain-containing protein [Geothermobacter hydrogeniphilus]|uniref:histidine kinase n=1 Tax=Geothermobacter hydrogeniphilus TaxID=1969733 RepID=A0A1X0XK04_9BACT|nr:CHASE4 domain-containing protein [Geothermobacter hydrogeniphilus]ORJ53224.1 hypothetical protein B5V00_16500 [Geothermobacter hydrogeniphilus]
MRVIFRPDKIMLLLVLVLLLNLGLYQLSRKFYLENFTRLERQVLHDNLTRAFNAIYHDVDSLQLLAMDWAEWDDCYRYMVDRNPRFLVSNLSEGTLDGLQLNLLLLLDRDGNVVWKGEREADSSSLYPDSETVRLLVQSAKTLDHSSGEGVSGLFHAGNSLWMVALQPILDSRGTGPSRGTLIMGRRFSTASLASLSQRIHLDLQLEFWNPEQVERTRNRNPSRLVTGEDDLHIVSAPVDKKTIVGHALLFDIAGKFGPVLTMRMERRIYAEGERTAYTFLVWTLVFSLLSAALIYLIMDRLAQSAQLRQENEIRYRRLSSEFRTILDGIPNSISLINQQRQIVWANRAGGAAGPDRFAGRDNSGPVAMHQCSFAEERCPVCCVFRTGQPCEDIELEDGGRIQSVKAFPLKNLKGDGIRGVIRIASDVTEEYRLRTEHEQASRLAAVGELAAGVAHEINNPNGMIQMNLGLVADVWNDLQPLLDEAEEADPDLRLGGLGIVRLRQEFPELLQDMHHASLRIKGIVEDLKGFVRRQDDATLCEVDLNEVYRTAVRLLNNQIKKSGASFREVLADHLPMVYGQFRQLEQVVINLVMNACQAIEKPGALLEIRTWHDLAAGEVVLVVEDGGKGIAPADLERITDPFFTTRRTEGGTGLGLSVSGRIIKEHGGRLLFRSEVGKGTTAELRLPVAERDE